MGVINAWLPNEVLFPFLTGEEVTGCDEVGKLQVTLDGETWAAVAKIGTGTSISGRQEVVLNRTIGLRWPSSCCLLGDNCLFGVGSLSGDPLCLELGVSSPRKTTGSFDLSLLLLLLKTGLLLTGLSFLRISEK